jgi:hypothetical protein
MRFDNLGTARSSLGVQLASILSVVLLLGLVLLGGCSRATSPTAPPTAPPAASKREAPIAPEQNPPGDIPDSQVFVPYSPPGGGFKVKVPEGWSRTNGSQQASFTDKLNTVTMTWKAVSVAPTPAQVESADVRQLSSSVPAFQVVIVKPVALPGGKAVNLVYRQNGEPNAVTGKRYRLDVERYIFFRNGVRADLILTSPVGADNVDPWRTISQSFKWE